MCAILNSFVFISKGVFFRSTKTFTSYINNCKCKKNERLLPLLIIKCHNSGSSKKLPVGVECGKDLIQKGKIFKQMVTKDKESFLKILETFNERGGMKRGHVEFIYAALQCMEEYNVTADLEVYKKLIDIFPKGKMIPKNLIQAEFYHHPRQQECAIEVLDEMEYNFVCPDLEFKEIILNIFGKSTHVFKKLCRMMYWIPKFKNKNPYLPSGSLPSDIEELARLALRKMSVDPRTRLSHFKTVELDSSIDKTWIVNAQSPVQQKLLLEHNSDKPLYVEGTYLVWMRKLSLSYFVLKSDPIFRTEIEVDDDDVSNLSLYMFGEPKPKELTIAPKTIHEQEDGVIYAMCATGTSSKDSVVSWIHFLKQSNPVLDKIPILFKLKSAPTALTTLNAPFKKFDESIEVDHDLLKNDKELIKEEIC